LLTQFLGRAAPLEAKYIVKLLQGDLRIGLREGAVEDAVHALHQLMSAVCSAATCFWETSEKRRCWRVTISALGTYASLPSAEIHARFARLPT
jgi:ATP-dependent DNA ligase